MDNKIVRIDGISETLLRRIYFFGEDSIVYAIFDIKGELLGYTELQEIAELHFGLPLVLYKTTAKYLYLLTRLFLYPEIDPFQIMLLENRRLNELTTREVADRLNISEKEYKLIEEGSIILNEEKKKEICEKLNINGVTSDFIISHFLIKMEER